MQHDDEISGSSIDEDITRQIYLAPMVRGSELAFRNMVRAHGVRRTYSPMLRANEVLRAFHFWKDRKGDMSSSHDLHEDGILLLNDICCDKEPLVVQLCGSCPDTLYAATHALMELQASIMGLIIEGIDLNLGCPQECAKDGNFGAFLVENDPQLAVNCIKEMRRGIDTFDSTRLGNKGGCGTRNNPKHLKLSCKIRLFESMDETVRFAKQLEEAGCDILAVHCRHRVVKHNGSPDIKHGQLLVDSLSIPVIINGSLIQNLNDIKDVLEETKAHGVMIARAFLENPCLLMKSNSDPAYLAAEYLDFAEASPPPSFLYVQKHLRWIFGKYLRPEDKHNCDYTDFRPRLWSFLVRPYLKSIIQFRQVVALYVKLNGSILPDSLKKYEDATFKSIKNYNKKAT